MSYGVTVLTLEPLDFNMIGNSLVQNLQGLPTRGHKVIKVQYPASFAATSIDQGVAALDTLVKNTAGYKLVYGHSQGAQVASRWLRTHATDSNAPAANTMEFLFIGNPLRKYGGYIIGKPEVGGQTGLPTLNNTQYNVTDVKLQYDGWCDQPTRYNVFAKANASIGMGKQHCFGYRTADLNDPARKTYQENTTLYVMLPSKPLTRFCPQSSIEAAYTRPEV